MTIIHNNASPVSSSHIKMLYWTSLDLIYTYFSPDSDKMACFLTWAWNNMDKGLSLSIYFLYFSQKQQFEVKDILMVWFITNIFLLHKIIIDGLEFWRHPFATEDPLLGK